MNTVDPTLEHAAKTTAKAAKSTAKAVLAPIAPVHVTSTSKSVNFRVSKQQAALMVGTAAVTVGVVKFLEFRKANKAKAEAETVVNLDD